MKNKDRNSLGEKKQHKSIQAYIFVRSQGGDLINFLDNVQKFDPIKSTSIVAGDYDVVIRIGVDNLQELMDVTDKIQRIHGIQQTSTHIIEKEVFYDESSIKPKSHSK